MRAARHRLAVALADAFLSAEWTPAGLRGSGSVVVGSRHRWIRRLVVQVLAAYHRPPADRPRELAEFICGSAPLAEVQRRAQRRQRPFPVPIRRPVTATVMVRFRFPIPRIDDTAALSEVLGISIDQLLWLADTKQMLRRGAPQRLQHYRSHWLSSGSGGRLLEAPKPLLRDVQRTILRDVLSPIPVHPAAHGFVPGRSVRTGALPHVGAEVVICMDLQSFFASIRAGRIYGILLAAGYPEPVAHLLTGLCTQATPVEVLRARPKPFGENGFRLNRLLAEPHLPQGAPPSPQLSNLCAFHLDRRLAGYAAAVGATYTRYADDLTLSGSTPALTTRPAAIVAAVTRIAADEGYSVNTAKTRIRFRDNRQQVTGVVVNQTTSVPRHEYDRLRALLHNCVVHGPQEQNRAGHPDFRAFLRGRIAWVASLDPHRGRQLLDAFDRIDWSRESSFR